MKKQSLKDRIEKYLQSRPGVKVNGGEIERLALSVGYKASNASRRCRELFNEGKIKRQEIKGSVWYWYESQVFLLTEDAAEKLFQEI